ncbi:MAG: hypothetical protein WCT37_00110 [Patescibacteria group bacterium]|jgi:hypothetical protein
MINLIYKKAVVWLCPIALIILWEEWLNFPRAVLEVGLCSFLILGGAVWYLTWRPVAVRELQTNWHRQEFWRFAITPGFFLLSVYLFLLIIENRAAEHFLILGANLILWLILQNLFDRFYRSNNYPASSFETISGNVNSLSLFFLVTVWYSFSTFLDLPVWQLALMLVLTVVFLTYQIMWISGLTFKASWFYLVIIVLIAVEFFWVMLFLPNTFYVKAMALTVAYYLASNLSRNHLLGLLTPKMVWRYLAVGGGVLVVVLVTAQWL